MFLCNTDALDFKDLYPLCISFNLLHMLDVVYGNPELNSYDFNFVLLTAAALRLLHQISPGY